MYNFSIELEVVYKGETYCVASSVTMWEKEYHVAVKKDDFVEQNFPMQTYLIPEEK